MQTRHRAAVAAAVLAFVPGTPAAEAAPPTVDVNFTTSVHRPGAGGWLVVLGCRATVTTGSNTQVPLATKATCSVNDTERSVVVPGAAAATQIAVVVPLGPVYACVSGEAAVMDVEQGNNQLHYATNSPPCHRLDGT